MNPNGGEIPDAIAIVGMAGRFPGAANVEEFWQNLVDGKESITYFNDDELIAAGEDPSVLTDPNYFKGGRIVEDSEMFDAGFFGYSPGEARIIDPQQRLFLECSWEAIETAGYDPGTYDGTIGVFAGSALSTYLIHNLQATDQRLFGTPEGLMFITANDKDYLATRVSYKLDLKGPAVGVQTACSSSLVAVHLACESLLNSQCDMALAGGVAVVFPQKRGYLFQEGSVLARDGRCRAFDAAAEGTVFGNGAAIVVLKRLDDAVNDKDYIYGIIRGSAVNNDGSGKIGYTAPSAVAQAQVIAEALAVAQVDGRSLSYVEAHGTGTTLGDVIEIEGLRQAFGDCGGDRQFCAIGTSKTNIGHLDAAAGVAGLIKTALSIKHQVLPASLNFETPNPKIDFADTPFYVNDRLAPWQSNAETPRRAGVSSFGMGGTNSHVIVEEFNAENGPKTPRAWHLLNWSARSETALDSYSDRLADFLESQAEVELSDVSYTLQQGRRDFENRAFVVCENRADAISALRDGDSKVHLTSQREPVERDVCFMFSGQGSQYVNMGRDLYTDEPVFRREIDNCSEILKACLDVDLIDVLYPEGATTEEASERLKQTAITQPALFAVEYALAKLWMSWGIQPAALIGHSIGEYVAACLAGVFSLQDALALVTARGRLMQSMPRGGMLAVLLPEDQVTDILPKTLSIAAINSNEVCVVSGSNEDIEQFRETLTTRDIGYQEIHTSHAFHSAMMEPILTPFVGEMTKVELSPPQIPFVSNVTGDWITDKQATDPEYWAQHIRGTVRFADCAERLLATEHRVLLEVGPGQALLNLARRHAKKSDSHVVLASTRHPKEEDSDSAFILRTLGELWLAGVTIDWEAFHAEFGARRIPVPTYAFDRERHWVEPERSQSSVPTTETGPDTKQKVDEWFYTPYWRQSQPVAAAAAADTLLVFGDSCGLSDALLAKFETEGRTVVMVKAADAYSKVSATRYEIDPKRADDYERLAADLIAGNTVPGRIAHFWGVTDETPFAGIRSFEEAKYKTFYSLVFLTRLLRKLSDVNDLTVHVVSSDLQDIAGETRLSPEKASLPALCKVLQQEFIGVKGVSIDVVVPKDHDQVDALVTHLARELEADVSDRVIAYRGGKRWAQRFERMSQIGDQSSLVRDKGTYLITGGLGEIGLILSEHLVRTAQANLVLTSRSPFPDREAWPTWLKTHDDTDRTTRRIKKLMELEALGGKVVVSSVDVSDVGEMTSLVDNAISRFGKIDGVFHAAGIVGKDTFQPMEELDEEACEAQFRAKVHGLYALEEAIADKNIAFCMLISSLSAALGGVGFAAYAAANAFMDRFAEAKQLTDTTRWHSVDFDSWQSESDDRIARGSANLDITPAEGGELFDRLFAHQLPANLLVSTHDLESRIDNWVNFTGLDDLAAATDHSSQDTLQPQDHGLRPTGGHAMPDVGRQEQISDMELGEIEAVLLETKGVAGAVASVWSGDVDDRRLVAYVIPERGKVNAVRLRKALRARVAEKLIPQHFVEVDAFPMAPNGTVDRTALPSPLGSGPGTKSKSPESESERSIAGIWSETLGRSNISRSDHFFDIGGHSLLAIKAVQLIQKKYGVRLDPRLMVMHPLSEVAASLDKALAKEVEVE